jgi:pyrroline-5-carboxylate reductase
MSAGSLRPVAFVGGGHMAQALAEGFGRAGLIAADEIAVHDPAPEATARFAARVPGVRVASANAAAVRGAPLVFLAVKPQHAEAACREAAGALAADATVVSIVAGVPIATLAAWLGSSRIVRVMPNTPCLIGKGVSALSRSASVPAAAAAEVARLLTTVGSVHDVDEPLLDAVTGLSGSGPGFVTLLIEGLIDGGVKAGLPRALARELALGTVAGTAALVAESGDHPAVIRDRVTSPAGTTIAGLAVLERHATRGALVDAVVAATDRAAELGRPALPR